MVTIDNARKFALSLPGTTEKSHFERPDFRVGKRIFAVLHVASKGMVIKLTPTDQSVFCAYSEAVMQPVPGGWGRQGWTMIHLPKIRKAMFEDALRTAWKTVAPVSLRKAHFPD